MVPLEQELGRNTRETKAATQKRKRNLETRGRNLEEGLGRERGLTPSYMVA
jgi:hypothetical protein